VCSELVSEYPTNNKFNSRATNFDFQVLLRVSALSAKSIIEVNAPKASVHDSNFPGDGGGRTTGSTRTREENTIGLCIVVRALE